MMYFHLPWVTNMHLHITSYELQCSEDIVFCGIYKLGSWPIVSSVFHISSAIVNVKQPLVTYKCLDIPPSAI